MLSSSRHLHQRNFFLCWCFNLPYRQAIVSSSSKYLLPPSFMVAMALDALDRTTGECHFIALPTTPSTSNFP